MDRKDLKGIGVGIALYVGALIVLGFLMYFGLSED